MKHETRDFSTLRSKTTYSASWSSDQSELGAETVLLQLEDLLLVVGALAAWPVTLPPDAEVAAA